jgi:glycosyltransferase involved in cell wall biosynthesis
MDKKLIVAHLGCPFFPHKGGSSVRLGKLISNQPDISAHVITAVQEESPSLHGAAAIFRIPNVNSPRGINTVFRILKRLEPDVVLLHNSRIAVLYFLAMGWRLRARAVIEIHSFRKDTWIAKLGNKIIYKAAAGIVVLSESSRRYLIRQYNVTPSKIGVMINGCDPRPPSADTQIKEALSPTTLNLGYVGSYYDWQGIRVILDCIESFGENDWSNLHFHFAGAGPLESEIKQRMSGYVTQGKVSLHGWLEGSALANLNLSLDGIMMPRTSTLGTELVIPLKVVDAMREKKIIIASKVGGLLELLDEKCAYLVQAGNPNSLKKAILHIKNNRQEASVKSNQAQQASANFSEWKHSGEKYQRYLRELAQRR